MASSAQETGLWYRGKNRCFGERGWPRVAAAAPSRGLHRPRRGVAV